MQHTKHVKLDVRVHLMINAAPAAMSTVTMQKHEVFRVACVDAVCMTDDNVRHEAR